ncbi:MAG: hypothetical protein L3J76_03585, partial [Candidatus Hydrothermae bacterium]|nr:hypothetical protein [Candidatus Hydrothermae bacterium]
PHAAHLAGHIPGIHWKELGQGCMRNPFRTQEVFPHVLAFLDQAVKQLLKSFGKEANVTVIHALLDSEQGNIVVGAVKGGELQQALRDLVQRLNILVGAGRLGDVEELVLTTAKYHLLCARVGVFLYAAMLPKAGTRIGLAKVRFQNTVKQLRQLLGG